ncbi:MAG: SBBP repeat-containing protein [Candidatus Aminicenantes bacterium]|nr:SBBP repeat-containing protein [Candidatus Aminicenantes bacterium]
MKKPVRKKKVIIIFILAFGMVFMQNRADTRAQKGQSLKRKLFKVPLYFIPNQGQVNEKALFYAGTPAYTLWITKEGLVFDSTMRKENPKSRRDQAQNSKQKTGNPDVGAKRAAPGDRHHSAPNNYHSSTRFDRDVSRLIFVGANPDPEVVPLHLSEYKVNYLKGNERLKWRSNVPTSRGVLYKNIYNNIDLKVYGNDRQIEYDWIVKPGADPGNIRFAYQNVKGTRIDNEGNLVVETLSGELLHKKPGCYQEIDYTQTRVEIKGEFEKTGKNTYGFRVGEYDENCTLVIDPLVLVYSTYLGGRNDDFILDMAVDGDGYVYLAGYTGSKDFPTRTPYQGRFNDYYDVFVTKLSKEGDALIYSTYLGGSEDEYGRSIAVDSSGSAYVTGDTGSGDFPTKNPFQGEFSGRSWRSDAFVVKLSPQGNALQYSTYLGGDESDCGCGIAFDGSGSAYVTGYTNSENFPVKLPFQRKRAGEPYGSDAFVTKFRPDGSRLLYSTYLGGSGSDEGMDIAVDSSGNAYITGNTNSKNFPLKHPFMAENQRGYTKVFLTKLSGTGRALSYSTYLGGSGHDYAGGIAVDDQGCVYVCGYTESWDFPMENPFQTYQGLTDPFVSKFSPGGDTLVFSTYLGGSGTDSAHDLTVDGSKYVYVTGYTLSTDFPVSDAFWDTRPGGEGDSFIARLMPEGNALSYSTYLGGTGDDSAVAIVVDRDGCVYAAGTTSSTDFPMKNPFQGYRGERDAFVTKLTYDMPPSITITSPVDGENVAGTVIIRTEAADDKGIERVDFYINNQLKHSDTAAPYNYAWDTRRYAEGTCYIKAAALDTGDCQTTAQITVKVRKIVLTLRVSKSVEKAWIVRQDYIKIDLSVQNPENIPVAKFVIYKKEPDGKFRVIKEIPGTELYAGSCTINDLSPGKGITYTYKAVALDADGTVIAVSNAQSVTTAGSEKHKTIKNRNINK